MLPDSPLPRALRRCAKYRLSGLEAGDQGSGFSESEPGYHAEGEPVEFFFSCEDVEAEVMGAGR